MDRQSINNLQRHGTGIYEYNNGNRFLQPSGRLIPVRYEGEFQKGECSGTGKFFFNDGDWMEGTFAHGEIITGCFHFSNGDVYTGSNKAECYFLGEFANAQPHGKGELIYRNGDVYAGTFSAGKRNGKEGSYRYSNGDKYEGEYKVTANLQPNEWYRMTKSTVTALW